MNTNIQLNTKTRLVNTKEASYIPAIVYGGETHNTLIKLSTKDIEKVFNTNAFHTQVITLVIDKKETSVLLKDWQIHPINRNVTHMDFYRVSANSTVDVDVPVRIIGEETCKALTDEHGVLQQHITELNVSCLPKHIPEHIDIDISKLALKESFHASEVSLPKKVTLNITIDETHDPALVSIQPPTKEEIVEDLETPEDSSENNESAPESET